MIIGGSIHDGQIQTAVRNLCALHQAQILEKPFDLFLCCLEIDKALLQFEQVYPELFRNASLANGFFGGKFLLDKMNFMERFLVKKIEKVSQSVSKINEAAIHQFAQKFNSLS